MRRTFSQWPATGRCASESLSCQAAICGCRVALPCGLERHAREMRSLLESLLKLVAAKFVGPLVLFPCEVRDCQLHVVSRKYATYPPIPLRRVADARST